MLNEIFKMAIVSRSWKNREKDLANLYRLDTSKFVDASQAIMLKIVMIPSTQQKSAD
jgi:hypothetical protein